MYAARFDRGDRLGGAVYAINWASSAAPHRVRRWPVPRQRRHVFRAGVFGLFAPYWRSDARSAIGLSRFNATHPGARNAGRSAARGAMVDCGKNQTPVFACRC